MNRYTPDNEDDFYPAEPTGNEDDLWFLPGPMEEEPDDRPPGPKAEPGEGAIIGEWIAAQAGLAAELAHVAGRHCQVKPK